MSVCPSSQSLFLKNPVLYFVPRFSRHPALVLEKMGLEEGLSQSLGVPAVAGDKLAFSCTGEKASLEQPVLVEGVPAFGNWMIFKDLSNPSLSMTLW